MTTPLNTTQRPRSLSSDAVISNAVLPSPTEAIAGEGVKLIQVDPSAHAQILFDLSHNMAGTETLWDYMGYGPFEDADAMAEWMAQCATSLDTLFYILVDNATGNPFGMASYLNIHPQHGSVEIGNIWIAPTAQRTTIATEAIYLMMTHALDGLKYRRLEWKCNALNGKSRAAAKRFGFSFEGVFYNHMIVKGKNRDTAWFSITDAEWPPLRANFKTWLATDNFDADGQQKCALSSLNWD